MNLIPPVVGKTHLIYWKEMFGRRSPEGVKGKLGQASRALPVSQTPTISNGLYGLGNREETENRP